MMIYILLRVIKSYHWGHFKVTSQPRFSQGHSSPWWPRGQIFKKVIEVTWWRSFQVHRYDWRKSCSHICLLNVISRSQGSHLAGGRLETGGEFGPAAGTTMDSKCQPLFHVRHLVGAGGAGARGYAKVVWMLVVMVVIGATIFCWPCDIPQVTFTASVTTAGGLIRCRRCHSDVSIIT